MQVECNQELHIDCLVSVCGVRLVETATSRKVTGTNPDEVIGLFQFT
jgi:hypothetical protein